MSSASEVRRRLGLLTLTIAAAMLLGGQTVLEPVLNGFLFIGYWGICFLFTIGSIVIAVLDVRSLRRQSKEMQQEIIEENFGDLPDNPLERLPGEEQKKDSLDDNSS